MKTSTRLIAILLLFLTAFNHEAYSKENTKTFNVQRALSQLESIDDKVRNQSYSTDEFSNLKEILLTLEENANDCVEKNRKSLSQLERVSSVNESADDKGGRKSGVNSYLEHEKAEAQAHISNCELILYKTEKLRQTVNLIEQHEAHAFEYTPMPSLLKNTSSTRLLTYPTFNLQDSLVYLGLYYFADKHNATSLVAMTCLALVMVILLKRLIKYTLKQSPIGNRLMPAINKYLLWAIFFEQLFLFLSHFFEHIYPTPTIQDISKAFASLFFARFIVEIITIFAGYKKTRPTKKLIKQASNGFTKLLIFSVSIAILCRLVPDNQVIEVNFTPYVLSYLAVLFSLLLLSLKPALALLCKSGLISSIKSRLTYYFSLAIGIGFVIATALGFGYVTYYVASRIVQTIFLFGFIWFVMYILWVYINQFCDPKHPLYLEVHQRLGLKPGKKMIELWLLRILITLAIFRNTVLIFFNSWGLPKFYLFTTADYIQNSVRFLGVSVNVVSIFQGTAVFCGIIVLGRLTGVYIARNTKSLNTKSSRITITTLTNYITFVIALLAALYVGGINLSGFTLIASALSVGIGFGLKGIAADMVSGLILLLSKPLRPGDHIVIGDTEGFIERVRLLSTRIKTIEESNVILPNATLLGKSVINYTYKSKQARIKSQVMLERTKDVDKVKSIMLDVASKHPDIEQAKKVKPEVIVDLRPERSVLQIVLTLWCVIKDVDERFRVNSDINAKILKALEKAKIPLKL